MLLHIEFHSTLCKDSDTLTTTKVFSGVVKEELLKCFSRSRKLKKKKKNRKKDEYVPGNKRTTLKSNKKKSQDNRCTAAIESSQSKLEEEVRRLF